MFRPPEFPVAVDASGERKQHKDKHREGKRKGKHKERKEGRKDKAAALQTKSIQALRAERVAREQAERSRQLQLLRGPGAHDRT
jgi:hypothetical protein